MDTDPKLLEKDAYLCLEQEKLEEAYRLFRKAADIYKIKGNHKQSALCFASAASCWALKSGEKTFYNSATLYEEAARASEISGDFEYASLLYRYAAISFERDMEFINFSECFYRSKECQRKFFAFSLINPKKIHHITESEEKKGIKETTRRIFLWFSLTFSYLIWGHGERPGRTFYSGIVLIFLSAFFYTAGYLMRGVSVFKPNLFEAFYFSAITFTTVGYGDITPIGLSRLIAIIESFCGLFIVPIFIIGLSRKYLRI